MGASILDPATVVTLAGAQTLINKTLVTPIITGSILDANSNEILSLSPVASAVNEINISNAVATAAPTISATGSDANINLNIQPKGSGNVVLSGISYPNTDGTLGQVLSTNGSGALSFVDVPVLSVGTVTTTDATPTVIPAVTILTVSNTAYYVEAKFLARETTPGTNVSSFIVRSTISNVTGTVSIIGTDLVYTPAGTLITAEIIVNGTSIEFQVTGTLATTIL